MKLNIGRRPVELTFSNCMTIRVQSSVNVITGEPILICQYPRPRLNCVLAMREPAKRCLRVSVFIVSVNPTRRYIKSRVAAVIGARRLFVVLPAAAFTLAEIIFVG